MAPQLVSPNEVVKADAKNTGDDLEKAEAASVAGLAKVGCQGFEAPSGGATAAVVLQPEGGRYGILSVLGTDGLCLRIGC